MKKAFEKIALGLKEVLGMAKEELPPQVEYRVCGYDSITEKLIYSEMITTEQAEHVRQILQLDDMMGCVPVTPVMAFALASDVEKLRFDLMRTDYFVEAQEVS
jgi:hypothetical protein